MTCNFTQARNESIPSRCLDNKDDITQYEVTKTYVDQRSVTIPSPPAHNRTSWARFLRRAVPSLQKLEIADLLAALREPRGLELGVIPGRTAWILEKTLKKHGIEPIVSDASEIQYHATVKRDGATFFLLNDDSEENERYCLDLIARGCQVVYWES